MEDSETEKAKSKNKSLTSSQASETENLQSEEKRAQKWISENIFVVLTSVGILLGACLGYTFRFSRILDKAFWTERRLAYVKFPAELYGNMLRSMSLPILLSSIAAAVGSMDFRTLRFVLWRIFAYAVLTALAAAALGLLVTGLLQPGNPAHHPVHPICYDDNPPELCTDDFHPCFQEDYTPHDLWIIRDGDAKPKLNKSESCKKYKSYHVENCQVPVDDQLNGIRALFPPNLVDAFLHFRVTEADLKKPNDRDDLQYIDCTNYSETPEPKKRHLTEFHLSNFSFEGENILGLICYFLVLGIAALYMEGSGRPILNFLTSLSEISLLIGTWIIWLSPIGICSKIAGQLLEEEHVFGHQLSILYYLGTGISSLLLHTFGVLPFMYFAYLRESPRKFYANLMPVMLVACGSSSSISTVPLTIKFLEERCRLDPRIVRLAVPILTVTNMSGLVVVISSSAAYIAQLHDVNLSFGSSVGIIFNSWRASTKYRGTHRDVLTVLYDVFATVLHPLGLPAEFDVYIYPVLWILDYLGTMTGVISVCVCTAIISHMSIQQLEILRVFEEHQQQQQQISESELQPSSAQASSQNPTNNADVNVSPATNETTDNKPLQLTRPFGGKEINTVRIGEMKGTGPFEGEEDSTAHAFRARNPPIPTKRKITTTFLALKRSPKPGPGPGPGSAWVAPAPSRGKERSKSKGGTSKTSQAKKSMKKNSKKKSITSGKKRGPSETQKRSRGKSELVSSSKKRKSGSTSSPKGTGTGSLFVSSYAASGQSEAKPQSRLESQKKAKVWQGVNLRPRFQNKN